MISHIIKEYNFDKIKQVRNILVRFTRKDDFVEFSNKKVFNSTTFSKDYFLIEGNFYAMMRFKDKIFLTPEMDQKNKNITFFTIRSPNRFIQMNQENKIKSNE